MKNEYYKHYKGGIYQVIDVGRHSETLEEMVIYRNAKGQIWVRPISMWLENVKGKARFEILEKHDGQIRFSMMENIYRND